MSQEAVQSGTSWGLFLGYINHCIGMYLTTHHVTKTLNTWSHTDYVICLITKTEIQLLSNLAWHQDTDTGQLLANQRAKLWYHWVKHSTVYISIAAFQHPRSHYALCYKIENPSCLWYIDQTYQTLDWFFSNYVWIDWYLYININANCRMYCGLLNWHSESFSKWNTSLVKASIIRIYHNGTQEQKNIYIQKGWHIMC